ncbi:MAG: hypothetical protein ACXV4C_11090 [Halobacteriota archaeon]
MHKRTYPDQAEYERRGRWMVDTINGICEPCSERYDDGSGVIMDSQLMCSCGTSPLKCKTVADGLQAYADNESDEDTKRDLIRLRAWVMV